VSRCTAEAFSVKYRVLHCCPINFIAVIPAQAVRPMAAQQWHAAAIFRFRSPSPVARSESVFIALQTTPG